MTQHRISRKHVEDVLARVGGATDKRLRLLDQIKFPADVDEIERVLGLSADELLSQLGGSP